MTELRVRRGDLSSCELAEGEPQGGDPSVGEAQLLVERFALSANNVSYGAMGDQLGYWRVFPAPGGWGRIPAWGHARVLSSESGVLREGERVYGLVPMGTSFTVRPEPKRFGFADAAPHRAELSAVYNRYLPVAGEGDDAELIMRPLFATSVLLDRMLAETDFDGAGTVVLTSASSKTAYGLAHLLRERPVRTSGLTSPVRREWVEGLGLYDEVLAYDELDAIAPQGSAVLVDFAGDRALLRRLHEKLGPALVRSILVGFTHWRAEGDEEPLPGPEPGFFFAPDEMARRGPELTQLYVGAWQGFAPVVEGAMRIERVTDGAELVRVWQSLVDGGVDPQVGYVVSLTC